MRRSVGTILVQALIIFMFIYEIKPLNVSELFTSRKIVFAILVIAYCIKNKTIKIDLNQSSNRNIKSLFYLSISSSLYVGLLSLINQSEWGTYAQPLFPRTIFFIAYVPIMYFVCKDYLISFDDFMKPVYICGVIQSIIVLTEFYNSRFASFLNDNFFLDAHTTYLMRNRAVGLGAGDSLLSIDLFLGIVAASYYLLKAQSLFHICLFGLMLFATFLSGSIGTVFGILLLLAIIYYKLFKKRSVKGLVLATILVLIVVGALILAPQMVEKLLSSDISNKIQSLILEGVFNNSTSRVLRAQAVAPLSIRTLFGTGIYRGQLTTGLISMSDTGYLQMYFGAGLIFTIIFYFSLYKSMWKSLSTVDDPEEKFILLCLFIAVVIGELKEPYIFHYGMLFVFFLGCFSSTKSKNIEV